MAEATTVIDIVAQVTDETAQGANSAMQNVSKLEKSMLNLSKQIQGMKGKSKLEVKAELKDMASRGIQAVAEKGKKIAGKVWTVTLKAIDLVSAPFKKVWGLISNPITQVAAFAGVSLGVADTINTFKDFEQGMMNVKSIVGDVSKKDIPGINKVAKEMGLSFEQGSTATETSFNALTEMAKHLGETTQFSASEAAEAMENLAMAGHKTKDILAEMPGLLDLAAAGSVDLATASDVTASALAQFKMDASESGRVADVLAATATNSKTDVQGLGESFKYAGSLAGALGYNIEDVAVAFGIMGNSAIDASSAGTALRGMLARMSKQDGLTAEESNAVSKAMKKVGVSMTDSSGKSKSLLQVMKELRKGFQGMSDSEKSATAANLAGQNAMSGLLAIVNASDEDFDKLTKSIKNSDGAAKNMADTKMDSLEGSLKYLQSAAEGVKIAIGEKLGPYIRKGVDWITAHMPDVQDAVGAAVDFITGKIDSIIDRVGELTSSPEWQQAETLWDKVKLAWDKLIAEPFDEWWNGSGKAWLAEKANSIGEGIGTALHDGLMGLLGISAGGAIDDGLSIGQSFADGFLRGFDGEEVGKALAEAIKSGMKALVSDAATLLPGGKEASSTSGISAAILGAGAIKAGTAGYKVFKGAKAIVNGTKAVGKAIGSATGITDGIQIAKAAKTGGAATQSALAMAENGTLGLGTKIGAKAAATGGKVAAAGGKLASGVSKAMPFLGGVISAVEMGVDAYHGTDRAEEWTGKSGTGAKVASGIGAALGGTGNGVLGDESVGKKTLDVGGGALKGAGIGGAIGAGVGALFGGVGAVPGAAIGSGIGAGVGAIGAAIGGSNIAKGLSAAGDAVKTAVGKAGEAIKGFFTETVPEKFGEFKDGVTNFFTETVPNAVSGVADKVSGFFTETIPGKFDELMTGIGSFFGETVPYAIGYAAGKIQIFFTETVPEFFNNLWDGITGFFTETVPAAIETVGSALGTFLGETVPEFFTGLWDGIVGFFTETVPAAIETVGTALGTFFTETVPQFFTDLWDGITTFFTETVPNAISTVGEAVGTFITETIPSKLQEFWDGIVNLFTQKIPAAISAVGEKISGFFSGIGDAISGFFSGLKNKVTSFISGAADSASAGYEAATAKHAEGGIMTSPHVGMVAEDGAEAIIPLSGKRRNRGISLWKRAGELLGMNTEETEDGSTHESLFSKAKKKGLDLWQRAGKALGVKAYAEGGIVGIPDGKAATAKHAEGGIMTSPISTDSTDQSDNPSPGIMDIPDNPQGVDNPDQPEPPEPQIPEQPLQPMGGAPTVTIDNITFEINVDGGDAQDPQTLVDTIRENVRDMTDEIAYQLAVALQQAYTNTPKTAW